MNKLTITIALVLVGTVSAAVTYNMNNAYRTTLLTAYAAQDGASVSIILRRSLSQTDPNDPNTIIPSYSATVDLVLPVRDPNSSNAQYLKNRIGLIADAMSTAHDNQIEAEVQRVYHASAPASSVVPPSGIQEQ